MLPTSKKLHFKYYYYVLVFTIFSSETVQLFTDNNNLYPLRLSFLNKYYLSKYRWNKIINTTISECI